MSQIKLGVWAKDKVTGFTGFVTSKHTSFSGMVQYGLQPHNDKGDKILDPMSFDVNHLEYIDKGVSDTVAAQFQPRFSIGQKVRDKITGYTGTITSCMVYLNGCYHFNVTCKLNVLQKLMGLTPSSKSFEWQRLESVDDRDVAKNSFADEPIIPVTTATAATASTAAASQPLPPGGPNDYVPSSRMD